MYVMPARYMYADIGSMFYPPPEGLASIGPTLGNAIYFLVCHKANMVTKSMDLSLMGL